MTWTAFFKGPCSVGKWLGGERTASAAAALWFFHPWCLSCCICGMGICRPRCHVRARGDEGCEAPLHRALLGFRAAVSRGGGPPRLGLEGRLARGPPPASWVCPLWLGGREGQGGDICLTLLSASVTWCVFSQELITLQHVLINIWSWSERKLSRMLSWRRFQRFRQEMLRKGWL